MQAHKSQRIVLILRCVDGDRCWFREVGEKLPALDRESLGWSCSQAWVSTVEKGEHSLEVSMRWAHSYFRVVLNDVGVPTPLEDLLALRDILVVAFGEDVKRKKTRVEVRY